MTTEQAFKIVAKQLMANVVREIQWEDIPDVGEQDFLWLMEVLLELAPEQDKFNEAITLLESRAGGISWNLGQGGSPMTCNCCGTELPDNARTLLCGPCMRALVLYPSIHPPRQIRCNLHGNFVDSKKSQWI
jgi:hypothetical protein